MPSRAAPSTSPRLALLGRVSLGTFIVNATGSRAIFGPVAIGTMSLYILAMARSTTYSALRANLKEALDRVCEDHEPLLVERKNGESVVVVSEADYAALEETAYLLRSPENARRLISALHGDRKRDKKFSDVDELREKLGLGS